MKIGEVVEELIYLRDKFGRYNGELTRQQDDAICQACNILAKLPNMEEAIGYEPLKDRMV